MTNGNLFEPLWSIDCPVKGSVRPSPYRCLLVDGWVPRKCILCPHLFEGECAWEARGCSPGSFALRVTPVPLDARRGPPGCLESLLPDLLALPDVASVLVVLEGDVRRWSLREIQGLGGRLTCAGERVRVMVSVHPGPPGKEPRMFVVVEQAG